MVTKISYYPIKQRIYVSVSYRKTDIYYDLSSGCWSPKKIAKEPELISEIFKFAGIKSIEEFAKIRTTYIETQEADVKRKRNQDKFINNQIKKYDKYISYCNNSQYYYYNGFETLDEIIKSLDKYIDTSNMKEEVSILKFSRSLKEFYPKYSKWLNKRKDIMEDDWYKIMSIVGIIETSAPFGKLYDNRELIGAAKKAMVLLNRYKDLVVQHKEIALEPVLIPTIEENISDYENHYIDYIERASKKALDYIISCGGIYVIPKNYENDKDYNIESFLKISRNNEEYSLTYKEDIDKGYYKACVKHLGIGINNDMSIDVDIEKAIDLGIDVNITETKLVLDIVNIETTNEREMLKSLLSSFKYKGENIYFYPIQEIKSIDIQHLTSVARKIIDMKPVRKDSIEDIDFREGYYIIKNGYSNSYNTEHFLFFEGNWYRLDFKYRKVIKSSQRIA